MGVTYYIFQASATVSKPTFPAYDSSTTTSSSGDAACASEAAKIVPSTPAGTKLIHPEEDVSLVSPACVTCVQDAPLLLGILERDYWLIAVT